MDLFLTPTFVITAYVSIILCINYFITYEECIDLLD